MADNVSILDSTATTKVLRTTENASGVHTPHRVIESLPVQHIDAFSRLRTSNPAYRFDSAFTYDIDDDLWDTAVTGDGSVTHDATDRLALVNSSTTAGANTAILQTHYHSPYTPGRGMLAFMTFAIPTAPPTNGEVGVGYYDGTNGVYLKQTASAVTLNVDNNTNAANQSVAQASWNIDPMDGTGPSEKTLDLTKTNILVIQLQALYVGAVTVAFDIDGTLYPVHRFNNANTLTEPYLAQASLPVRYWANTSTDAADAQINAICSSVISEGGQELADIPGRNFVATGELANTAAGTAIVIRPKAQFNGINQNALVLPTGFDVTVADAGCWVEIRRNATVTAGTFTDVDALSTVEASFAGNAGTDPVVTAGTGTLILRRYVAAGAQADGSKSEGLLGKELLAYSHLLAAADSLALIWNGGAGTTDIFASLDWRELR